MPAHTATALRERRRQRRETRLGYDIDDRLYRRRVLAIGCETTTLMRVPTLDWPANLFVDSRAPEVEITT